MKLFAFAIAALFFFQAATPVLCGAACPDEHMKMLRVVEEITGCENGGSCCMRATDASCDMMLSEETSADNASLPCTDGKNCCTPCCAIPLCTCYYQESVELDFTSPPLILAAQLPSSNGIPHDGFCADCFQPPENI